MATLTHYCTLTDLLGDIDPDELRRLTVDGVEESAVSSLDAALSAYFSADELASWGDNGQVNVSSLKNIADAIDRADRAINLALRQSYTLPLTLPADPILTEIAVALTLSSVYRRRNVEIATREKSRAEAQKMLNSLASGSPALLLAPDTPSEDDDEPSAIRFASDRRDWTRGKSSAF